MESRTEKFVGLNLEALVVSAAPEGEPLIFFKFGASG